MLGGEHVELAPRNTGGDVDAQPGNARLKRGGQDLGVPIVTSGMDNTQLKQFMQSALTLDSYSWLGVGLGTSLTDLFLIKTKQQFIKVKQNRCVCMCACVACVCGMRVWHAYTCRL